MKHKEKKYLVDNFTLIRKRLDELGEVESNKVSSKHLYTRQKTDDVVKLV